MGRLQCSFGLAACHLGMDYLFVYLFIFFFNIRKACSVSRGEGGRIDYVCERYITYKYMYIYCGFLTYISNAF